MQFAQPLICEARIFTSSAMVGSNLAVRASGVRCHSFIREGAAAKASSLTVMSESSLLGSSHDDRGWKNVTRSPKCKGPDGAYGSPRACCKRGHSRKGTPFFDQV